MMKQQPLFKQPEPYHNGTATSRCAADAVRHKTKAQARRVLEFIASMGEAGATDAEIQTELAMPGDSQRPRRRWLQQHGYIEATDNCRMTANNRPAKVWRATGKEFPNDG